MVVNSELVVGFEVDGVTHKKFVMRPATINDVIAAIEKAGDKASNLRLRVFKAAEQLESLGGFPKDKITGELLLGLPEDDIEPLFKAQDEIEKKRKSSKNA